MNMVPAIGNLYILVTVLVATATKTHKLTTWKVQRKTELRVYKGVADVTNKYPYVVVLLPSRLCTGSLITPDWVLTAAHCCEDELSDIQYGKLSIPLNETESKTKVIRAVSHPRYEPIIEVPTDIALLHVSPAVRIDKYGTLSAVDYSTLVGLSAEFVGGGATYIKKRNARNQLKRYMLDQQRPLQIGQAVVSSCEFESVGLICVSPKCSIKQMVLPGDSGGPLLVNNNIVGVSSGMSGDWEAGDTDRYYTPISPHQEWIHRVITSKPN